MQVSTRHLTQHTVADVDAPGTSQHDACCGGRGAMTDSESESNAAGAKCSRVSHTRLEWLRDTTYAANAGGHDPQVQAASSWPTKQKQSTVLGRDKANTAAISERRNSESAESSFFNAYTRLPCKLSRHCVNNPTWLLQQQCAIFPRGGLDK